MSRNSISLLLNRLLGGQGEKLPRQRHQDPTPQQRSDGTWFFIARVDVILDGRPVRSKKTVNLPGTFHGKREARAAVREAMEQINRVDQIAISQVRVSRLLEQYNLMHVSKQSASTQGKYRSHIKNHIQPAFGELLLCDLADPLFVQRWLDSKKVPIGKLSWATCNDIRNILSSMFTQAKVWGLWEGENPIEVVTAGRKKAKREKRKLTDEQTRLLLAMLPYDLRIACCVCLFCTLRISEAMALKEKSLNFKAGLIEVRERYWRGDLDQPKNDAAIRDLPMGHLAGDLKRLCQGDPERFVFQIETHPKWGKEIGICRDDRDLHQHFLRPAAEKLGFYWEGFGFHALRREAVTSISGILGVGQAMKMAGHSTADMSLNYTLADLERQDTAVRTRQESIMGTSKGGLQ
jgi:integrase